MIYENQLENNHCGGDRNDSSKILRENNEGNNNNNNNCREIRTLEILREFQQLYQNKLNKIEDNCTCSSTQIKVHMLQDWVHDLTEQNTLLVQAVEELEQEASERVSLLEEKLRNSSKTSYEIMKTLQGYDAQNVTERTDTLQRIMYLQSDVNNLTEFVRRVRDEGVWSVDGLHFYCVAHEDLCGDKNVINLSKQRDMEDSIAKLKFELSKSKEKQDEFERESKEKDRILQEQSEQLEKLNNVVEQCASSMPDRQRLVEEVHELRAQMKIKSETCIKLEKLAKDEREALTAEVADKHDSVVALRHECQLLEERCRQADKQTHFKDDIIKEMRKELKQLRVKFDNNDDNDEEKNGEDTKSKLTELEYGNKKLIEIISEAHEELNSLHKLFNKYYNEEHDSAIDLFEYESNEYDVLSESSRTNTDNILKAVNIFKNDINRIIHHDDNVQVNKLRKKFQETENVFEEINNKNLLIKNKDEMIKIQSDSLNVTQNELADLRNQLMEIESERNVRVQEVCNLRNALELKQNTIEELERALQNSEEKATNMQQTADLYANTIQLLESSKSKIELENGQQRITIGNLQEALVNAKRDLEEMQTRNVSEIKEKINSIHELNQELTEMYNQYTECYSEIVKLTQMADCLRNSNLDLEVDNYNLRQDIQELNVKIVNDKNTIQLLEENTQKILCAKNSLENDFTYMKNEMTNLAKELQVLQQLLKILNDAQNNENSLNLMKTFRTLQEHSEHVESQLKQTQIQVDAETKFNETKSAKIEELLKLLETKTIELHNYESKLKKSETMLDDSIGQCEVKIKCMEEQVSEHKILNEQKTEELISNCNTNLMSLQNKVEILNEMLKEKSDELIKLHTELSIKSDMYSNLMHQNEMLKQNSEMELRKVKQNVQSYEDVACKYKLRCTKLDEKCKQNKTEMETMQRNMIGIEKQFSEEKKSLNEKLVFSQENEIKLNNVITELKLELEQKNKVHFNGKDGDVDFLNPMQKEIISLKEEINRVTKIRNRILSENQKLQEQTLKININASQFENQNKMIAEQLDKCLEELNTLHCAKEKLEKRNVQLETEMEQIQHMYNELNQEIRYKNESVVNLEQELNETKCSRDEICAESRIVVGNVRAWLDEQKCINVALNNTIQEKNHVIEQLSLERNSLLKNIKEVCMKYNALSQELQYCREYLTHVNADGKPHRMPSHSTYIWDTQGSVSSNSPILVEEHGYEYNMIYDEDSDSSETRPDTWAQKINTMNAEVQKSKQIRKSKRGTIKKLKPVKDFD